MDSRWPRRLPFFPQVCQAAKDVDVHCRRCRRTAGFPSAKKAIFRLPAQAFGRRRVTPPLFRRRLASIVLKADRGAKHPTNKTRTPHSKHQPNPQCSPPPAAFPLIENSFPPPGMKPTAILSRQCVVFRAIKVPRPLHIRFFSRSRSPVTFFLAKPTGLVKTPV